MLAIHIHRTPAKLASYHEEHLERGVVSDYYAKGASPEVVWTGKAAKLLGLEGQPVTTEQFSRFASNVHPVTGKSLTPRKKENARSACDFVFSMPKPPSVLAGVEGDERILDAHRKAVAKVTAFMEQFVQARVRKAGANEDRSTGNMAAATFEHLTSRENDPQVHSHVVIFNATWDEEERTWKAMQSVELFRRRGLFTEVYRSALVKELHAIGYRTKATKNGFEIVGVPQEVCSTFSKRKKQIDTIAAELGGLNNPALRSGIARKHRKAKDTSLSITDLRASWEAQLSEDDLARLRSVVAAANGPLNLPKADISAAIDWAARHHFERKSAVRMIDLATSTLAAERGHFEVEEIEEAITAAQDKFIVVGGHVTTHTALAAEQELIATVHSGIGQLPPVNPDFPLSGRLSQEQREVASSLLLCQDRFSILIGPPGARKTSTLQPIVEAAHDAMLDVTLLAPSGSATDTLRKDGFLSAMTMQRFLQDKDAQAAARGGLVVLDEAGLASVDDLLSLSKLAVKHDFRCLLSGDPNQHKSVTWGDGMRLLVQHSSCHQAALRTISRQQHEGYLQAVTHFKDGKFAEGLGQLSSLSWIKEADFDERYSLLAADFSAAISRKESTLAVAATWREAALVTEAIRASERSAGRLSTTEESVSSLVPQHYTQAEREQPHLIADGSVLVFARKSKLFSRNEHVTVTGHLDGFLTVRRDNGETIVIDPKKHSAGFQVFQPQDIPVAAGDCLLLRANAKTLSGSKLINGQLVNVKAVKDGCIHLDDGRSLPAGYRHFTHGYCITSQASQGKTVDHVFLAIDAESASTAATQETLYVGTSRGRHSCTIYTDGIPELEAAFSRSSERIAAIELTKTKNHEQPKITLPDHRQLPLPAGHHPANYPAPLRRGGHSLHGQQPPPAPERSAPVQPQPPRQPNLPGLGHHHGFCL